MPDANDKDPQLNTLWSKEASVLPLELENLEVIPLAYNVNTSKFDNLQPPKRSKSAVTAWRPYRLLTTVTASGVEGVNLLQHMEPCLPDQKPNHFRDYTVGQTFPFDSLSATCQYTALCTK